MKSALLLSLMICSVYSINCSNAKLENICKEDVFDYENIQVNSYIRLQVNYTIPGLQNLLLGDHLNGLFGQWSDKQDEVDEIIAKKDEFNTIIRVFYAKDQINKFSASEILKIKLLILKIMKYFGGWYGRIGFGEKHAYHEVEYFLAQGNKFVSKMFMIKKDQANESVFPEKTIVYSIMKAEKALNRVGRLAFTGRKYYHYFSERIFQFDPIELNHNGMNATLSMYLPVFKFNYEPDQPCTMSLFLPQFYKENSRVLN